MDVIPLPRLDCQATKPKEEARTRTLNSVSHQRTATLALHLDLSTFPFTHIPASPSHTRNFAYLLFGIPTYRRALCLRPTLTTPNPTRQPETTCSPWIVANLCTSSVQKKNKQTFSKEKKQRSQDKVHSQTADC